MNELLKLHKKMYDVRWNQAEGDQEQLEKEFIKMVEREGIDLEKANEMLGQLYIAPYDDEMLPDYLKSNNHGGKREGAGRPSLGTTKKVSLTLPDEVWERIDYERSYNGASQSQTIRDILIHFFFPVGLRTEREDDGE
jgi:hypothetical protein